MKELEKHISEQTEVHSLKPVKKEVRILTTLKPKPGQKIFELNLTTAIINEVLPDEKSESIDFKKAANNDFSVKRKLTMNKNCIYCCAINAKNADKKFHRMLGKTYKKQK